MERVSSSASQPRQLTAQRVAGILSACIIPDQGPNKLTLVGRGNTFPREDGTVVRIFNVQAFASVQDAQAAAAEFQLGLRQEKGGDLNGAQAHYKAALNKMMNFSVLEENAADFEAGFQINGRVEMVPTRDGGQKLGINNPRPVEVVASGAGVGHMFQLQEAIVTTPVTQPTTTEADQQAPANRPSLDDLKGNKPAGK